MRNKTTSKVSIAVAIRYSFTYSHQKAHFYIASGMNALVEH